MSKTFQDVQSESRVVYVNGTVDNTMGTIRTYLRGLVLEDPLEPIYVTLSSVGGSILGGFALMDEIELLRADAGTPIHGIVQGYAMSMATSILQCCERRIAGPNTILMIHGSHGGSYGDLKDRRANERLIEIMHRRLATVYSARTMPLGGRSYDDWMRLMEEDVPIFLSAPEALEQGLIDQIVGGERG